MKEVYCRNPKKLSTFKVIERSDTIYESDLEKKLRSRFGEETLERLIQKKLKASLEKNINTGVTLNPQVVYEDVSDGLNKNHNVLLGRVIEENSVGTQGAKVVGIVQQNGIAIQLVE